ncbi:chorismate synthase [Oceanotoga teriensis]|uniref:Chorismate synthase n=1 Tax=Oceanotoga teriensis TaxID=515440 RepID=A0AA45C8B4_9BACT|nr:chorismate synthase [Oceanotoga teriensis]MDO7976843.1 chorismate synthase [Oceanotoga teriensis]PWJ95920.1 chorismate synthase [Oceanotoga teriensis]
MFNIEIAGDSHGKYMMGIIKGIPAGIKLDLNYIKKDLKLRKNTYGRGKRMNLEDDNILINSGIYNDLTTGAPISLIIENKGKNTENKERFIPRPGHGDYTGYKKYGIKDLNIYTERNSARWTVVLTAIGSICRQILELFDIKISGYTKSIGYLEDKKEYSFEEIEDYSKNNLYILDEEFYEKAIKYIDEIKEKKDSIGGKVKIISKNVIPGLGSYSDYFNKIDSKIGKYFMSIPSVKGVLIGKDKFKELGSDYNDEFIFKNQKISRKSNNVGGIEAGLTNGEEIEVELSLKPIPTILKNMNSVDLKSLKNEKTSYIRSDNVVVSSMVPIGISTMSIIILEEIFNNFGDDNIEFIKNRYFEKKGF